MPYIRQEARSAIDFHLHMLEPHIQVPGRLAYAVYRLMQMYVGHSKSFDTLSGVIGAVDCAKEEFRRRVVNPYEDAKIKENGDV